MTRTPREGVEAYNLELWNKRRYELADELIADTVIRHGIGTVETLTREQSVQRIIDAWRSWSTSTSLCCA